MATSYEYRMELFQYRQEDPEKINIDYLGAEKSVTRLNFNIESMLFEHFGGVRLENCGLCFELKKLCDQCKNACLNNAYDCDHLSNLNSRQWELLNISLQQLADDINAVYIYRQCSDSYSMESFEKWFPNETSLYEVYSWICPDRDFIYTSAGCKILIERYLRPNEPIQYAMLRIARLFAYRNGYKRTVIKHSFDNTSKNSNFSYDLWELYYKLLSCGFLHVSSILADSDVADESIVPGEACRLFVAKTDNGRELVKQIGEINDLVSLGVGVGLSAATIPKYGSKDIGRIKTGYTSIVERLNSATNLSICDRKPKVAIYLGIHNDTVIESLKFRDPLSARHIENCFFGVLLNDYFMKCVRENRDWYLFPADCSYYGQNLSDLYGDEYERVYNQMVQGNMYTARMPASALMSDIVKAICVSGSPYIIFDDHLNNFNNLQHLGKIKTLNLCAEIANYSDEYNSSSCTLMSTNMAFLYDFPDIFYELDKYVYNELKDCEKDDVLTQFPYGSHERYAFVIGYLATKGLNNLMGQGRLFREIGVTPLGVYDAAIVNKQSPQSMSAELSEALYMGCIMSSIVYTEMFNIECSNYIGSEFQKGHPQWFLRDVTPLYDWQEVVEYMKNGMANSMLTAQAPTATTSILTGATESVTLPMSTLMVRENDHGRSTHITYGLLMEFLNTFDESLFDDDKNFDTSIKKQIEMYQVSAPYIDHSQSTMFSIQLNKQSVFNIIRDTYLAKLKTGIYYILPRPINETLTVQRLDCDDDIEIKYLKYVERLRKANAYNRLMPKSTLISSLFRNHNNRPFKMDFQEKEASCLINNKDIKNIKKYDYQLLKEGAYEILKESECLPMTKFATMSVLMTLRTVWERLEIWHDRTYNEWLKFWENLRIIYDDNNRYDVVKMRNEYLQTKGFDNFYLKHIDWEKFWYKFETIDVQKPIKDLTAFRDEHFPFSEFYDVYIEYKIANLTSRTQTYIDKANRFNAHEGIIEDEMYYKLICLPSNTNHIVNKVFINDKLIWSYDRDDLPVESHSDQSFNTKNEQVTADDDDEKKTKNENEDDGADDNGASGGLDNKRKYDWKRLLMSDCIYKEYISIFDVNEIYCELNLITFTIKNGDEKLAIQFKENFPLEYSHTSVYKIIQLPNNHWKIIRNPRFDLIVNINPKYLDLEYKKARAKRMVESGSGFAKMKVDSNKHCDSCAM